MVDVSNRDEWNKHIDNGKDFSDFYPYFRDTRLWKEWLKYASACLETGMYDLPVTIILQYFTLDQGPEQNLFDNSQAIEIHTDANGKPILPSVTAKDNPVAKHVQTAIRLYCKLHIRESETTFNACVITYPF